MIRNSDSRLRELERMVEATGDDADALAFVRELQRADRLASADLRPSMQTRILDALARQASSGSRDDVLLYMKVLTEVAYPKAAMDPSVGVHHNDLIAAIAAELVDRQHDPEAVYRTIRENFGNAERCMETLSSLFHGDGHGLEDVVENAEAALERTRRRSRGRGGRRVPGAGLGLAAQRTASARRAYELARHDELFTGANIDNEHRWQRNGDVWRRQIDIGDGMGWTATVWVEVTFAPDEARVVGTRVLNDDDDDPEPESEWADE